MMSTLGVAALMAAVERDGVEPVTYLYALADDPAVSMEHGSLNYLAEQFGQHPDYVGYYRKTGPAIVPDIVDAQLADGQGVDFTSATPDQIAYAVDELVQQAAMLGQDAAHGSPEPLPAQQQPRVSDEQVPDEQILEELAAALGADMTEELQAGAEQSFTQLTLALWKEILPELQADLKAAAQGRQWAGPEEAKAAAQEAVWAALTAAVDGYWQA